MRPGQKAWREAAGEGGVAVVQVLSAGSGEPGVFAVGQFAHGFVAVGQVASGFIAIGQEATGVIAIGQLARGFVAVGQLAVGVFAIGMGAVGVAWASGMVGVGGTSGPGLVLYGLFGRFRFRTGQWPRRLLALVRGEPWDTTVRSSGSNWRWVIGLILLPAVAALWWFVAGHAALAAIP
jgi:hypothetical protein